MGVFRVFYIVQMIPNRASEIIEIIHKLLICPSASKFKVMPSVNVFVVFLVSSLKFELLIYGNFFRTFNFDNFIIGLP